VLDPRDPFPVKDSLDVILLVQAFHNVLGPVDPLPHVSGPHLSLLPFSSH